jgi:hypothetical protein
MSWKSEVQTDDTGKWYSNALRFATREEADAQVSDLKARWTSVMESRTVESSDPVNYRYENHKLIAVANNIDGKSE